MNNRGKLNIFLWWSALFSLILQNQNKEFDSFAVLVITFVFCFLDSWWNSVTRQWQSSWKTELFVMEPSQVIITYYTFYFLKQSEKHILHILEQYFRWFLSHNRLYYWLAQKKLEIRKFRTTHLFVFNYCIITSISKYNPCIVTELPYLFTSPHSILWKVKLKVCQGKQKSLGWLIFCLNHVLVQLNISEACEKYAVGIIEICNICHYLFARYWHEHEYSS